MKLVSVSLTNFRAFRGTVTIPIDDLTVFIGKNDVGKSSVLDALAIFFGNESVKLEYGDCNVFALQEGQEPVVEITCEFDELPEAVVLDAQSTTNFRDEYLLTSSGRLKVKKRYTLSGSRPREDVYICALHPATPGYQDLLTLSNTQLKQRLQELNISDEGVDLRSNPSIRRAIWQSCSNLVLHEQDIPVNKEDAKRIWEKLEPLMPVYALFKSDRPSQDTDSEVQDPMKLAISEAIASVSDELRKVEQVVREKAEAIARETHEQLRQIDESLAAELVPEFRAEPKWLSVFSITMRTEAGIPLNKRGSGVRRLVLLSFFRAAAERRRQEEGDKGIIYAVEEPETSQHPKNQKLLVEAFRELANSGNCQILLTTHSPSLAKMLPPESLRYLHRTDTGFNEVLSGSEKVYEQIVESLGVMPDSRVKLLLCVEGPTDVIALKWLSRALHLSDPSLPDLTGDTRVAFVPLGGGTLQHWVDQRYLRELGCPEVHIYDSDAVYSDPAQKVNQRGDGSCAFQTRKREIENYLHPEAIKRGLGIEVPVDDYTDLPQLVGRELRCNPRTAKRKLADYAFPCMDAQMVDQRDPEGEVRSWLQTIANLLGSV